MKEIYDYKFSIKCLAAGQKSAYQDSFYSYEVTSDRPEYEVKAFCMHVLRKSYPKNEMPNPFAGELLEFTNLTNKKPEFPFGSCENTYLYRTREEYTG